MTESTQLIPADGISRLTLDISGVDVSVRWVEELESITIVGAELPVDRAGDELFIRADLRKRSDGDEEVPEIRIPEFSSPGQLVEEILKQTGLFTGRRRGRKGRPLHFQIPVAVQSSVLEIDHGDLTLADPRGKIDCTLKDGDFVSAGGDAALNLASGSGDVQISGLRGSVRASGGSGDVALVDVSAVTNVKAGSGTITLTRVTADAIKLAAGSGDIDVTDSRADAFACDCGSGDVLLSGGWLNRITVRTGSGAVRSTAGFEAHGQSITTGSGGISFGIPRGLSARIEAFTSIGDIDTDLPLVSVGQRGPRSRRSNRQVGSVGVGEPRAEVSVRTSSGDIRIHWLPVTAGEGSSTHPPTPAQPHRSEEEPRGVATPSEAGDSSRAVDERQAILESLAQGEISVDEAEALLRHIEGQNVRS